MLEYVRNLNSSVFDWVQHSPFDSDFLPMFCALNETKFDSVCDRGSYFCESDIQNNFTIRRQPSFYLDAIATCNNVSSVLSSSNSASEIQYAKNGLKTQSMQHSLQMFSLQYGPYTQVDETQSKLQFDLKTIHTWINTTILNITHIQDGKNIKHINDTLFDGDPILPTVIFYSMDSQKLQLGETVRPAFCSCVKVSVTSKGFVFLNLLLGMMLLLLPLVGKEIWKGGKIVVQRLQNVNTDSET